MITHMERQAAHSDQSRRCFAVGFRDSNVRIVFPEVDDPLGIGSRSSQGVAGISEQWTANSPFTVSSESRSSGLFI